MRVTAEEKYDIEDTHEAKDRVAVSIHNVGHAMRIFASSTYQKPVEAVVRETIANAIDASRGKQFTVTAPSLLDPNFRVRDFGVGMDEDFFKSGYAMVGYSTKRESNDEIGGFGMGRFSAFAYQACDQYFVRAVKDGKAFTGSIVRNSDFEIFVTVVHREDTTDENGVEVIIPVAEVDHVAFNRAISVYTEFLSPRPDCSVAPPDRPSLFTAADGSWKISAFKDDDYRPDDSGSKLRAIMGGIPYPLDLSAVFGFDTASTLNIAVGDFHFPIGALDVPASREGLRYTDETKKVLRAKFKEIKTELMAEIEKRVAHHATDWERWTDKGVLAYRRALGMSVAKRFNIKDIKGINLVQNFEKVREFECRSNVIMSVMEVDVDAHYFFYVADDEKVWRRKVGMHVVPLIAALDTAIYPKKAHGRVIVVANEAVLAEFGNPPAIKTSTLPKPPPRPSALRAVHTSGPGGATPTTRVPKVYRVGAHGGYSYKGETDFTQPSIYVPFMKTRPTEKTDLMLQKLSHEQRKWVEANVVGLPLVDIPAAKTAGWLTFEEHVATLATPDKIKLHRWYISTPSFKEGHGSNARRNVDMYFLLQNGFKLPRGNGFLAEKFKDTADWAYKALPAMNVIEIADKVKGLLPNSVCNLDPKLDVFFNQHPLFRLLCEQGWFSEQSRGRLKNDIPALVRYAQQTL